MTRSMTAFLLVVFVVTIAALALDRLPPTIPPNAATSSIATVSPGQGAGDGACLDRMTWGSGWADLCWQASRITNEADPEKDYYALTFYGSFAGVRWLLLRSDLQGLPAGGAFDAWPRETYAGACRQVPVDLMPFLATVATPMVCGRTEGHADHVAWTQDVTWRCERCLVIDGADREINLYTTVAVAEGAVPSWDLFAAGG